MNMLLFLFFTGSALWFAYILGWRAAMTQVSEDLEAVMAFMREGKE